MKRILLTGGAGFIGHHIVEGILKDTEWEIVILDRLDVSGNPERLKDIEIWEKEKYRVKFIWWDLKSAVNDQIQEEIGRVDYIWHLAASSHVDRSIADPMSFVMDNVVGTTNLLLYAKKIQPDRIIYFSTDEVFGPMEGNAPFKEWDRYKSSNPYAASKAGGEEIAYSFYNTYKLPIVITHTMNVFGERQHSEKFVPMTIKKVLNGGVVTIHADKAKIISGSRFWIHARNVCKALQFINEKGQIGDKYNVVGEREVSNLEMAQFIAGVIGKPLKYEMVDFHSSRPGHDLRYGLDGAKLKSVGFKYPKNFEESLTKTIQWYLKHQEWI
jgi:dTDP-glucose 4,6-dehydratase